MTHSATKWFVLAVLGLCLGTIASAQSWNLKEAAAPYKGTTITVVGLDRPSYAAEAKLIPQFEDETGIKVNLVIMPYESALQKESLDFTSGSNQYDAILSDLIWVGDFAANKWVLPVDHFLDNPDLADPNIDLDDFIKMWRDAFTWDETLYGLPFDSYSGLLYYNECMLNDAGFSEPPSTWNELLETYAPKLTDPSKDQYAFALQSRRGETQTADSFMRMIWAFGGSLLDPATFKSNLLSQGSIDGIQFRQDLMKYMPSGIVSDDHGEVVQLMAQGKVAMITEWSSFYTSLVDPDSSKIIDCMKVAPEPTGPGGFHPAVGGFAYMVSAHVPEKRQNAAWLFSQWLTSKEMGTPLVENGAVLARLSINNDTDLQAKFPYLKPMVDSWQQEPDGYIFRPRFPVYPQISEVISNWGTQIQLGQVGVEEGLQNITDEMEKVLGEAGYYDGKTPLIQ